MDVVFFVAAGVMTSATLFLVAMVEDSGTRTSTLLFNAFYVFLFIYAGLHL
jgi:hypothetical protein